jgi:diaminopimelate decarboxylase
MSAPEQTAAHADPIASSPVYPRGSRVNEAGHLEVGGCDVVELAREHGTPAYIYSEDDIRSRAREYVRAFSQRTDNYEIVFASKAMPATAMDRLMADEGLSVDVASGGELHTALAAGVPGKRIHFHGNNKSAEDLAYAIEAGVGHIIIDNFDEIARLDGLLGQPQRVLIRLTPGIKPSTHTYIQTGQIDSKFGFSLEGGQAEQAAAAVRASSHLELVGLHAHLGSQIFELEPFTKAIEVFADFCRTIDLDPEMLNIGGGLGIAYEGSDEPPSIDEYAEVKVGGVRAAFGEGPRVLVEPGRSLVGPAGVTAYAIGSIKDVPGIRTYVAVDGGMSDNMRPMLYGANYEAVIADRAAAEPETLVTIAGMHCESSDIIRKDVLLAGPAVGDVLVTPATGAYGHSMASNYNGVRRPPVIFCSEGSARVVVRRETWDDLLSRDG